MGEETIEGFRLSPQQRRLWALQRHSPGRGYQAYCAIVVKGTINPDAVRAALRAVAARHEILRTTFRRLPGVSVPLQVITASIPEIDQGDLRDLDQRSQQVKIAKLLHEMRNQPFDLERGPLFRASLLTLAPDAYVALLSAPAWCADSASLRAVLRDVRDCYAAHLDGAPKSAPPQYADVSEWQNDLQESDEAATGAAFWRQQDLGALLSAKLPFADRLDDEGDFTPLMIARTVNEQTTAAVADMAEVRGMPTGIALFTGWAILLARLSMQQGIVIGTECSGRRYEELAQVIGPLARYVPVSCRFEASDRFIDVVTRIQKAMAAAESWQDYFNWDHSEHRPGPMAAAPYYFPFCFDIAESFPVYSVAGASFSMGQHDACIDRFDLKLSGVHDADALTFQLHYDPRLYAADDVARLADQLAALLDSAARNPDIPIEDLSSSTDDDRRRMYAQVHRSPAGSSTLGPCFHHLFEQQVQQTPQAVAVACADRRMTYDELNKRANRLALRLRRFSVGPDARVAIWLERSEEIIVALLAILKAGGAYVPMDPALPSDRAAFILADTGARVVVTQRHIASRLPKHDIPLVFMDTDDDDSGNENPVCGVSSTNLAYVLYTSGSTGTPKGVAVEHRQLVNYVLGVLARLDLPAAASFAMVSTFAADLGNTAIFPALCTGGCLYVITQEQAADPDALSEYVRAHPIDCLKIAPSHLTALLNSARRPEDILPRLCLILGGEAVTWEVVDRVRALAPRCRILNHYGPTEATVGVLTYLVDADTANQRSTSVPLGYPLANTQVYILNRSLEPVSCWMPGEVYIGGNGVTRGYLGCPALTADVFVPNPFGTEPGQRLYRTGDLARLLPDGTVEFLGRRDNQVKLHGFRIELGEIEAALLRYPEVQQAAVVVHENESGTRSLVAYVVAAGEAHSTVDGPQRYVLPNNMAVLQTNRYETDFFFQQIFVNQTDIRSGIIIHDGDCIFDVGANVGLFTLFVQQARANVTVYAFEPIPEVYNCLHMNVELYGGSVKLFQCGLSDRTEMAEFTYYPRSSCQSGRYADVTRDWSTLKAIAHNQQEATERTLAPEFLDDILAGRAEAQTRICQLRTLSDVIAEHHVERIDLLKIDVERSERDVLMGIQPADWSKIRQIVIEAHDYMGQLDEITTLLEQHSYNVIVEQDPVLAGTDLYNVYAIRQPIVGAQPARAIAQVQRLPMQTFPTPPTLSSRLRAFLVKQLPEYMVPTVFALRETLPLTSTGKVDRRALAAAAVIQPELERIYVPPSTPAEETLCGIWGQVLQLERVSVNDNFFELGGDSILSIQIVARANQAGLHLTPRQIFQHQTIAQLAEIASSTTQAPVEQAEQTSVTGAVPLTPIYHWFFELKLADPSRYVQTLLLELPHAVDYDIIKAAWGHLLGHHDILRARFTRGPDGWYQVLAPWDASTSVAYVDLSAASPEEYARAFSQLLIQHQAELNIEYGPLVRVVHIHLGPQNPERLLLLIHHLAVDTVSWQILLEDLEAVVVQMGRHEAAKLPAKTISFKRWAERLQEYAGSGLPHHNVNYWLQPVPQEAIDLPIDHPEGENTFETSRAVAMELNDDETRVFLEGVPRVYHAHINDALLTALLQAFRRWGGLQTLYVDLEGHGREDFASAALDVSRTVGWFTSLYPVLLTLPGVDAPDLQVQAIKTQLEKVPNRGLDYGVLRYLVSDSEAASSLRTQPRPVVSFNYLGRLDPVAVDSGLFRLASETLDPTAALQGHRPYLIEVVSYVQGGQLHIRWTYSQRLHKRDSVERLASYFVEWLRALVAHVRTVKADHYQAANFPASSLNQRELDEVLKEIGEM